MSSQELPQTRTVIRNPGTNANQIPKNVAYITSDDDDELHGLPTANILKGAKLKRNFESMSNAENSFFGVASSSFIASEMDDELNSCNNEPSPFLRPPMPSIPDPRDPRYYSQETIDRYGIIIELKKTELANLRRLKMVYDDQLLQLQLNSRNQYAEHLARRDEFQDEIQSAIQSNHKLKSTNTELLGLVTLRSADILRLESQRSQMFDTKDVYEQKVLRLEAQLTSITESLNQISSEEKTRFLHKLAELNELSAKIATTKAEIEKTHQKMCTVQEDIELWTNNEKELRIKLEAAEVYNMGLRDAVQTEKTRLADTQAELASLTMSEQRLTEHSQDLNCRTQRYEQDLTDVRRQIQEERQKAKSCLEQRRNEVDQKLTDSHTLHELRIENTTNIVEDLRSLTEELKSHYADTLVYISEATLDMQELQQRDVDHYEKKQEMCTNEEKLKTEIDESNRNVQAALAYGNDLREKLRSLDIDCDTQKSELIGAAQWLDFEVREISKAETKQKRLSEQRTTFDSALEERDATLISQGVEQSQEIKELEMQYHGLEDSLDAAKEARQKERLRRIELHKAQQAEAQFRAKERHDADCQEFQELQQVRLRLTTELKMLDAAAAAANRAPNRAKRLPLR